MTFILKLLFLLSLAATFLAAEYLSKLLIANKLTVALYGNSANVSPTPYEIHVFTLGSIAFFAILFFFGDVWESLFGGNNV